MIKTTNFKLIESKFQVHEFDLDNLNGPEVNYQELIDKVQFETDGNFILKERNIVWYANKGIINKSQRRGKVWKYPFRTIYDLIALWVIKNRYLIPIDKLAYSIKKSKSGLYETIYSLQQLEIKLFFSVGIPSINNFMTRLKREYIDTDPDEKKIHKIITVKAAKKMKKEIELIPALATTILPNFHKKLFTEFFKFIDNGIYPLYIDIEIEENNDN